MTDVNFSKYAFHHDIECELVSPIINVLSANTKDEINYRHRENKQD